MVFLSSTLNTVWSVLLAILILLVMITVHEFGHYVAGKTLKFKINEFAIGFGPKLFSRKSKKNGEVFSLRLLPLGGFCAFDGEDGVEEGASNREGSFTSMAPWKRIIVLVSGPLMNYLLALVLIVIGISSFGLTMLKVGGVTPTIDADYVEYSLVEGDVILQVNGSGIYLTTDLISALNGKKEGDIVGCKVLRGGKTQKVDVKLRADCNFKNSEEYEKAFAAFGIATYEDDNGVIRWNLYTQNCRFNFLECVGRSFIYSFKIGGTIFKILGELLTGRLGLSAVGGPVTTIKLTSKIASQSVQSFLEIAAYIGVNLAIFNLLPIPALDGSKVVFCLIEWIFKKPVPRKIEAVIHVVGFFAILAFAVLVDILQFV
jgi:regulator of sigma E protease